MRSALGLVMALLFLILATASAAAQEPAPATEAPVPPPAQAPAADPNLPPPLPPTAYAVGDPPAPVDVVYKKKVSKVWKATLDTMATVAVPIESADQKAGYVRTQLIAFDPNRFYDVATPPPTMSRERPIRQRMGLNQGRFSVEIQMTAEKEGTRVSIRAYVEEYAAHIMENRRIWVQRWSNGKIEKYFFDAIDRALGLKKP